MLSGLFYLHLHLIIICLFVHDLLALHLSASGTVGMVGLAPLPAVIGPVDVPVLMMILVHQVVLVLLVFQVVVIGVLVVERVVQ